MIFPLWADGADQEALNRSLLGPVKDALLAAGVARLRINVPDAAVAPAQDLYPKMAADRPDALISFFVNSAREMSMCEAALGLAYGRYHGYETTETTPLPNCHPANDL